VEVVLAVQDEIQKRLDEADRLRQAQVERARYEASLAQRRYMKVDPGESPRCGYPGDGME
jgi:hypothetical protein